MKDSKIEWTEHTFNPWWGCTKVSEGCTHCYAESFAKRTGHQVWGNDASRRYFGDKHWSEPVKWNAAAEKLGVMHRVFCGSMCDILEDRPGLEDPRATAFDLAEALPNLLWLFLTKRPENLRAFLPTRWAGNGRWPRNVMCGVTIENQLALIKRIPFIRDFQREFVGASMFASCEPLLSGLDWEESNTNHLNFFDWVIGGGESGHGARPMHPDWIRKLRDDCQNRTDMCRPWPVPFLFKQWGEYEWCEGECSRVDKAIAGRSLYGRTWDGVPTLPYGPQLPGVESYGAVKA